ncbi:hypothetical protein N9E31_02180 [Paracoccaceae bacterium]|nr:hypothetical protein [Paracoccaceae bacterium]
MAVHVERIYKKIRAAMAGQMFVMGKLWRKDQTAWIDPAGFGGVAQVLRDPFICLQQPQYAALDLR